MSKIVTDFFGITTPDDEEKDETQNENKNENNDNTSD